jgi:hypothetical protein
MATTTDTKNYKFNHSMYVATLGCLCMHADMAMVEG